MPRRRYRRRIKRRRRGRKSGYRATRGYVKRYVNRMIETKHYDNQLDAITITTTPTPYCFSDIDQSLTEAGRVGSEVKVKHIRISWNMTAPTSTDPYNWVRVTIIRMVDEVNATDSATWPPYSGTSSGASGSIIPGYLGTRTNTDFTEHVNSNHPGWQLLMDKVYWLNIGSTGLTGEHAQLHGTWKFKGKKVGPMKWRGLQGNYDWARGHYIMYIVSSSGFAPSPSFSMTSRLKYKDV